MANTFPIPNDPEMARAYNEFVSEPVSPQEAWPEAIGFEPTYEDEHTKRVKAVVEQATAAVDASTIEAQSIAVPAERDTAADRKYFLEYARGYGQRVQLMRDYVRSDADLAA